ncbi:hypothetical protein CSB37_01990 [bacterium DOLZORAL124_38_8]|nr:MAG: hypothetical protein CSB37_01990 [bacterium DOLZORAL124_38_8]
MPVVGAKTLQCQRLDTLPKTINEDMCVYDSVKLSDITKKDKKVSATVNGTGALVLQSARSGGFPRLIVLGGTKVTGTTVDNGDLWDGKLTIPKTAQNPNRYKFYPTGADKNDLPPKVEVAGTYQIGTNNTDIEFSEKAYASFWTHFADNTQLLVATEKLSTKEILDSNKVSTADIDWEYDSKNFCVVKNGVCMVELPKSINRIALVRLISDACPNIKIENGGFSAAPECKIVCNSGFGFDTTQNKCIPKDQLSTIDNTNNESAVVRAGYFRYRDTRGGQLTKVPGANDLNISEKNFVDIKNATVNHRNKAANKGKTENKPNQQSLWKQFQEFVWTTDTTGKYHKSRYPKKEAETAKNKSQQTEEKNKKTEKTLNKGALLPSTGSGIFAALAIAGVATMGFALRRRR